MEDPAVEKQAGTGSNAWASSPRNLALVAAVVFALLGLLALAATIDLPSRASATNDPSRPYSPQDALDESAGGSGAGRAPGSVDVGPNGDVDIRPIPGCPDGFAIGENIYVIPDPEACGFRRIEPGERAVSPNGIIILTPSIDGDIGRIRINADGTVDLLPPGTLGPNDFTIGQSEDGTFGLQRPDGSRVEITPGDDGLSFRDPSRGGSSFVPGEDGQGIEDGQGAEGSQGEEFGEPPSLTEPDRDEPSRRDDSSPSSVSALGPILLVILGLGFLGFLVYALRNDDWRSKEITDDIGPEPAAPVDYAAEISALDRLLWEIDQEPDPRLAIQRVYAALETGLDNPQMARRFSETPGLYLRRILGHFTALEAPLHDLTGLFEQARFSEHEITVAMRERAVTNLVAVRGHYAQAAATAAATAAAKAAAEPAFSR